MPDRFYVNSVTTPANTAVAFPLSTKWALEDAYITIVSIVVPDGHNGLTGIRLLQANQEIIPWSNNAWLIANDEKIDIPYNGEITISGLVIQTYNTDAFDHTHNLRVVVTDQLPNVAAPVSQKNLVDNGLLSNIPILGTVPNLVRP